MRLELCPDDLLFNAEFFDELQCRWTFIDFKCARSFLKMKILGMLCVEQAPSSAAFLDHADVYGMACAVCIPCDRKPRNACTEYDNVFFSHPKNLLKNAV